MAHWLAERQHSGWTCDKCVVFYENKAEGPPCERCGRPTEDAETIALMITWAEYVELGATDKALEMIEEDLRKEVLLLHNHFCRRRAELECQAKKSQ